MSTEKKLKQTPSQTAGPYLHIGFLPKKVGINSSFTRELNNLILSEKTEGTRIEISGKIYDAHSYGVNEKGWLDLDAIEDQATKIKPKMIIAGASAYSRQIEWDKFKLIADEVGAILLCDMAHYSGLIAGGGYRSPVPVSYTHLTLPTNA